MNTVSYQLNEALIAFGTAVDEGDLHGPAPSRAPKRPLDRVMWEQLSSSPCSARTSHGRALLRRRGQRLKGALPARSTTWSAVEAESGILDRLGPFRVQSKLAVLNGELRESSSCCCSRGWSRTPWRCTSCTSGKTDRGRGAAPAPRCRRPSPTTSSGSADGAGGEGRAWSASTTWSRPFTSTSSACSRAPRPWSPGTRRASSSSALLETIAGQLFAGMYEKAGAFFERLDQGGHGLLPQGQARPGSCFARCFRGEASTVVGRLPRLGKNDAAINHFTEAAPTSRRSRRQLRAASVKGAQIVETLEPPT